MSHRVYKPDEAPNGYSFEEYCPNCDNCIPVEVDEGDHNYETTCPICGKKLMLCTLCHDDHGDECDWTEKRGCKFSRRNAKVSKPVPFDDMIDVAFAEIYHEACTMEKERKIEPHNTMEEFARDCKQLAADFVEKYEAACAIGEYPSFYDRLYGYAEEQLKKKYPPVKKFDVLIDAQVTMHYPVFAKDKDEAEQVTQKFIESGGFVEKFRKESYIYDVSVGDVVEP